MELTPSDILKEGDLIFRETIFVGPLINDYWFGKKASDLLGSEAYGVTKIIRTYDFDGMVAQLEKIRLELWC